MPALIRILGFIRVLALGGYLGSVYFWYEGTVRNMPLLFTVSTLFAFISAADLAVNWFGSGKKSGSSTIPVVLLAFLFFAFPMTMLTSYVMRVSPLPFSPWVFPVIEGILACILVFMKRERTVITYLVIPVCYILAHIIAIYMLLNGPYIVSGG